MKPVKRDGCDTDQNDRTEDKNTQRNGSPYGLNCFELSDINK